VFELSPEEQSLKKLVAKQYPSQNIYTILFWHEVASKAKLKPKLPASERLRIQTHRDWLVPNHPSRIRERVLKCAAWKRWTAAVLAVQPELAPRDRDAVVPSGAWRAN
jgi:hypothetical protein